MTKRPLVLATLDGYAVEGGYDRAYQPTTCFSPTIALGRHSGPGIADELWSDYEQVLDVAATLGIDGVLLGLEWTRIEPRRDLVNVEALNRYRDVVRYARSKELHVSVSIFGSAWPAWLGLEAWLLPWVAPRAIGHAQRVVADLGDDVDGVVLFTDPKGVVQRGFVDGSAPPWRHGASSDAQRAAQQIAEITRVLQTDAIVAAKLVRCSLTLELDSDQIGNARARGDVDELHVRSLVRGSGPSAARNGLIAKHDGAWVVTSPEALGALR